MPAAVRAFMSYPKDEIIFDFNDPTEALVRCVFSIPEALASAISKNALSSLSGRLPFACAAIRLLTCSPLAADVANMIFFPETDGDAFDDYSNGERWARVQKSIPAGTAALMCVLFFDELNLDKRGFATSDGIIIVGGNFRRRARESTYAKLSLGSFPTLHFRKGNQGRACVKAFRKALRAHQLAAIRACFDGDL